MLDAANQNIDKLFQRTKGQLFLNRTCSGFLGTLLCKLKFQWTTEIPTAAVSLKTLYWNPDFFLRLDEQTRVTVLAHELYHLARLHHIRAGGRCPDVWNIAGDHVINIDLHDAGFYMGGFPYVMDFKYRGWSTEDVYDDLNKPGGKPMPAPSGESLSGDIMPFDGEPEDEIKAKHDAISDVISAAAAARMSNQAGSIPGETSLYIEEFLNPKLPWETILYNYFNELVDQEYSFARPNRRYEDPILRGATGRNGLEHLVYFLDISGSISERDILRFNSEVKFIQEELKPERLTLITFDTRLHDFYEFERDEEFEKIVVTGRGGTDLNPVFDWILEHGPTAAVIFTDLYVPIPENPGIDLIWAVYDNPEADPPFGRVIHVPPEEE